MTQTDLWLTVGDTPTLTGRVNADLTGASAEIHIRRPDQTVATHEVTVTDATTGEWSVELEADDLPAPGDYDVEVQVTFSDGSIQTFALDAVTGVNAGFHVRQQIA